MTRALARRRRRLPPEDPRQQAGTPRAFISICREFDLTVDLAANALNHLLPRYLTREDDALSVRWGPAWRCWCNPPYDDLGPWIDKAIHHVERDGTTTVLLLPARLEQRWWHKLSRIARWWSFDGRIQHIPPPGIEYSSPNFASVLAVVGPGIVPGHAGVRSALTGEVVESFDVPRPVAVEEVDQEDDGAVSFVVAGRPKAKGRPRAMLMLPRHIAGRLQRIGLGTRDLSRFIHVHSPSDTAAAEKRIAGNARPYLHGPQGGPLELAVRFVFRLPKRPASHQVDGAPYDSAPDVDNLVKLVKDALNALAYEDDRQVTRLVAEKVYGPEDATHITLKPLAAGEHTALVERSEKP